MRVSAIAAFDQSAGIGLGGRMPWHLPRDLKRFRKYTWEKPVIMGRKTFLSLVAPLAGRYQIVLTHKTDWVAPGCHVVHSVADALAAAAEHLQLNGGEETMIIGGGLVFQETLCLWERVYLTLVEGQFAADAFFPLADLRKVSWRLLDHESCPADTRNPCSHRFAALERLPRPGPENEAFDVASWLDRAVPPVCEPA